MKRVAVITGASSGLGWEFALQIDALDSLDEIWLVARRRDRLDDLNSLLKHSKGVPVVADLSLPEGCALLAQKLQTESPELVYFVNNAGFGTYGTFLESSRESQVSMVDVNVRALTDLSWTALRHMEEGGTLINVASLAAYQPLGNFAVYAATKTYVLSLSMALAAENEDRGVKVLALCPGSTQTEFSLVASGGAVSHMKRGHSAKKVVARCLLNAKQGRWTSLYALDWKITAFASRFFGRKLVSRMTYLFAKRQNADTAKE